MQGLKYFKWNLMKWRNAHEWFKKAENTLYKTQMINTAIFKLKEKETEKITINW